MKIEYGEVADGLWGIYVNGTPVGQTFRSKEHAMLVWEWLGPDAGYQLMLESTLFKIQSIVCDVASDFDDLCLSECSCPEDGCKLCELSDAIRNKLVLLIKLLPTVPMVDPNPNE